MRRDNETALAGRRVLELTDEKGCYAGKLFADMGADVIKVEPLSGDPCRRIPPFASRGHGDSLYFLYMNSSKRGVTLNLEHRRGRDLLRGLVASADLILESFPAGYLRGLGLGYESLSAAAPALVMTSISGFGSYGIHSSWEVSDLVTSAMSGALYVTGEEQDPPVRSAGFQAYMSASLSAAAGSMIALYAAAMSGRGQYVDISVQESMAAVSHICGAGKFLDDGMVPRRRGSSLFASVPSGAYRCRDGLIYLMVNRPAHWQSLAAWVHEVTGNQEILDPMFEGPSSNRIEHRELLDIFIGEMCSRFSVEEFYRQGQGRHIAVAPVNDAAAVIADPQLQARGYFTRVRDGRACAAMLYPGAPYRHSLTPWRMSRRAPCLGEHNEEVFGRELGLSTAKIERLREDGAI